MRPNKRSSLFLAGATAALIVIVALPKPGGAEPSEVEAVPAAPRATAGRRRAVATEERLAEQQGRKRACDWGRDPFRPPGADRAHAADPGDQQRRGLPRLTGVSVSGDTRMAIIDGEVVQPGERLRTGHTLLRITNATATLLLDDEEITLLLGDER